MSLTRWNETFINDGTTFTDFLVGVNENTNGVLGVIILTIIWFSLLALFNTRHGFKTSFVITNFITSIVSGLMYFIEIISFEVAIIPLVLLIISIITYYFQ